MSFLNQISNTLRGKTSGIYMEIKWFKSGILDGAGTLFKTITGNLDVYNGEYFTNGINKLIKRQLHIENLLKNQISVKT